MKSSEITIKKINISKGPSNELLKFISKIFTDIDKEKWEWEYKNTPKHNGIVWIATIDNKIAVHYAFIILNFKYNKKSLKVAKAEGSLANINLLKNLPKERRRLFGLVVEKALKDLKKQKIDLVYGFPNTKALKTQISSGYNLVKLPITFSRAIIDLKPILKNRIKDNFVNKIFIFLLINFANLTYKLFLKFKSCKNKNIIEVNKKHSKQIKEFFKKWYYQNSNDLSLNRDWEFYNWRYINNPYRNYKIFGYFHDNKLEGTIVLGYEKLKKIKSIHIMEINYINNKALSKLIKWSLYLSFKEKVDTIDIWSATKDNYLNSVLFKNGFINQKNNKKNMIVKFFNNDLENNYVNWSINRYLERI